MNVPIADVHTLTLYALRHALDSGMRGERAAYVSRMVKRVWPHLSRQAVHVIMSDLELAVTQSRRRGEPIAEWVCLLRWMEGE